MIPTTDVKTIEFGRRVKVMDLVDAVNHELGIENARKSTGAVGGKPAVIVHRGIPTPLGGIGSLYYVMTHDGQEKPVYARRFTFYTNEVSPEILEKIHIDFI